MATKTRGGVKRATANTVAAMARQAEQRRCPECGRKSALLPFSALPSDVRSACRWTLQKKCTYVVMKESE